MMFLKMRDAKWMWCGIISVLGLTVQGVPAAAADTNRIVVMISIDGLAGYYIDDPKAEMPTLRMLAAEGTRASSMKASTPTVTWPNHTTLVTGDNPAQHGVVGNNYLDRKTGKRVVLISDPVFDKDQIVKVPTIYDLAKAAGMKTAAIRWPATRNAKTLDWTIPDVKGHDLFEKYSTPSLVDECAKAGFPLLTEPTGTQSASNMTPTDETCTRAFNLILEQHRPQLALLHVIDVDHTEHLSGPRSPEAYAAVKAADGQVREVLDELKKDFPGEATLFVVSDHGFSPIERMVLPNVVLRKAGLLKAGKKGKGAVQIVVQGGSAFVYILDTAHRADLIGQVRKAFADNQDVSKIIDAGQFAGYGVADPKKDPHAPDMILFAKEGCSFGDTASGDLPFADKPERKGSHGHDSSLPDLHATFVAWGAGIKPGVNEGEITNTCVAPTIAKLLGIAMPNTVGQPLTAALKE